MGKCFFCLKLKLTDLFGLNNFESSFSLIDFFGFNN